MSSSPGQPKETSIVGTTRGAGASIRRRTRRAARAARAGASFTMLRPQAENVVHDAVEGRIDRRARAARLWACVVSRPVRRVGRRFVGRAPPAVGRRHVVGERVGLVGRRRRRVGDRCGRDDRSAAAAPLAEEEAREDNSKREQARAPSGRRGATPARSCRAARAAALILGRRLLAGRAELAERRVLERGRRVADAWRRVRCRFLERGLVRGRVRRLDGLVCLDGLVLLVCVDAAAASSSATMVLSCLSAGSAVLGRSGSAVVFSGSPRRTSSSALDATVSSFAVMVLEWMRARRVLRLRVQLLLRV